MRAAHLLALRGEAADDRDAHRVRQRAHHGGQGDLGGCGMEDGLHLNFDDHRTIDRSVLRSAASSIVIESTKDRPRCRASSPPSPPRSPGARMFPLAQPALEHVDAFHLTAVRYLLASAVFLALLAAFEGRRALRTHGRGRELWLLGTIGFAGFNLLTYVALEHTRPQDAALIVATAPVITVLVVWALGQRAAARRPARAHRARLRRRRARHQPRRPEPARRLQRAVGAAGPRRRARLDGLHAGRRTPLPRVLAAPLHGADRRARHDLARRHRRRS